MPEVSFTTVVRRAQTLGGITQSDQDGDGNILVCEFLNQISAERMRSYALDKYWHVPDEVLKEKGKFYVTIFSPPQIDYRNLLKTYIMEGNNEEKYDEDDWDALEDVKMEIEEKAEEEESKEG